MNCAICRCRMTFWFFMGESYLYCEFCEENPEARYNRLHEQGEPPLEQEEDE